MRETVVSPEFVEFIPADLQERTLYISIPYATAVHLCACGCGNKVVTPVSPAEWTMIWDGDSVSLSPSIGNWQFPCYSHYWIRRNTVKWAPAWTHAEIAEGRRRDAEDLESYFTYRRLEESAEAATTPTVKVHRSLLHRLKVLLRRR